MPKRVFVIVLDSMGIGEAPDAKKFGDNGANTLRSIRNNKYFYCPNLKKLGLFNIDGVNDSDAKNEMTRVFHPQASYARLSELSKGKDTIIGHWEIAGIVSEHPLPTYPNGFPKEFIDEFSARTGRKILCNKHYSGTEVIKDHGKEMIDSKDLIVYTSADSVCQIAAHEDVIPIEKLYEYCEIAREMLIGENGVGRVIARPFSGEWPYERTPNRHDFSLKPTSTTMLDCIKDAGQDVISVGKIYDIFAGVSIDESNRTTDNLNGMNITLKMLDKDFKGLCFTNLVDFDMKYGHRNDVDGYAKAMSEFDKWLPKFIDGMKEEDLLIITADHGCDPGMKRSNDHTREYIPMLAFGQPIKSGINLGTRSGFCYISATILDYLNIDKKNTSGSSFLPKISKK